MIFEEEIAPAKEFAKHLFESIIDQITTGPELTEEQIRLVYSYIAFHATSFAKDE